MFSRAKNIQRDVSCCVLLLGFLALPTSLLAEEKITALECGQLLDVEHKTTLKNMTILVKGERIEKIGKNLKLPKGATVVDLSNRTCLPGLMDMHYHPLAFNGTEIMYGKERSSAEYGLVGASNVKKMLDHGYTALRIPGHPPDPGYALVDLRNAINDGILQGPRLFVAPHMLRLRRTETEAGLIRLFKFLGETDKKAGMLAKESINSSGRKRFLINSSVDAGPEGAREGARRQIANGADWIKIHLDGGGQWGEKITPNTFTDEEVQAFVDETHRHKKRIVVGAHGDKASLTAILAGADSIDHGMYISESTAQIMKEKGTYLVPTLNIFNEYIYALDNENTSALSNYEKKTVRTKLIKVEKAIREEDKSRDASFQYAYKLGVNIANGSDQYRVNAALREFTYLVDQGVTTWDAITMATLNAADLLGMQDHIGSITVGKYADIIATPENPLNKIEALKKVNFVMKNGDIIRSVQF